MWEQAVDFHHQGLSLFAIFLGPLSIVLPENYLHMFYHFFFYFYLGQKEKSIPLLTCDEQTTLQNLNSERQFYIIDIKLQTCIYYHFPVWFITVIDFSHLRNYLFETMMCQSTYILKNYSATSGPTQILLKIKLVFCSVLLEAVTTGGSSSILLYAVRLCYIYF